MIHAHAAELACSHLLDVGMYGMPMCPWRLARLSGLDFLFVDGPVHAAPSDRWVVLSTDELCLRTLGAELARAVARLLLQKHNVCADSAVVERCARELLMPAPLVAEQLEAFGGDVLKLERHNPHVPQAWIADAAEDWENAVAARPLRPMLPTRAPRPTLRTASATRH